MRTNAKLHEFTIVLADAHELTPKLADALYQVLDDGTAGSCNGKVFIEFHRKAPSIKQAVRSAVDDLRKASLEVTRVETVESRLVEQINTELARCQPSPLRSQKP